MAIRAPHLHLSLRGFCLGAFVFLGRALEEGAELPFAFEEHVQRGGPALYEYRPLVRAFVESRASALAERDDARIALDELRREPAAAIFARAHAGPRASEDDALFRTILLSLLIADGRVLRRLRLGRPSRSSAPTRSSSARSSAPRARMRRSRRCSGSRS